MKRRWIGTVLFFTAILIAGWFLSAQFSLEALAERERSIRETIAEHPFLWWVLGFFAYVLISLVPGTRGKAIAGGWLFGFWPGLVLVNGALTLAAVLGFLISRFLLKEAVSDRYHVQVGWINRTLENNGAFYVILLRIVPVSYTFVNYLLGATHLRTRTFWWATHLGILPGNIVFVNAGAQLPTLHRLVEEGWTALFSWNVVGGLLLLSTVALVAPFVARYFIPPPQPSLPR